MNKYLITIGFQLKHDEIQEMEFSCKSTTLFLVQTYADSVAKQIVKQVDRKDFDSVYTMCEEIS
jgi:hypothetical protein